MPQVYRHRTSNRLAPHAAGAGDRTGAIVGGVRCQAADAECHVRGRQWIWWSFYQVPGEAYEPGRSCSGWITGTSLPLENSHRVLAQPNNRENWDFVVG
ncbi:hypothetical protein TIFTF001_018639 [Ficus carica]|uniref:Uncharacterized protein n=1 Tax=Ficus carica TaxID=3494 RepID=A0AA88AEC8_FICCA|nr:hypothetical protein TIFTF001_018639 [Ficus carica]